MRFTADSGHATDVVYESVVPPPPLLVLSLSFVRLQPFWSSSSQPRSHTASPTTTMWASRLLEHNNNNKQLAIAELMMIAIVGY